MGAPTDIQAVQAAMDGFVREKGWYAETSPKPQTPTNLALSLSVEAAELLECFQWGPEADADHVAEELADVVLYAAQLANVAGIDLAEAVRAKLERNRLRTWEPQAVQR